MDTRRLPVPGYFRHEYTTGRQMKIEFQSATALPGHWNAGQGYMLSPTERSRRNQAEASTKSLPKPPCPTERWERIVGNKPLPKWGLHVPQRGRKGSQEGTATKQNFKQCLHTRGKVGSKLGSSAGKKQQLNKHCSVRRKFSCWEKKKGWWGGRSIVHS